MKKEYKPRIADKLLARKLAGKGAVLIEGPKWCGKTTTAQQQAKSMLGLGDSEVLKQSRNMLEISPKTLLQGETPRLIDEWQALPPMSIVPFRLNRRQEKGSSSGLSMRM